MHIVCKAHMHAKHAKTRGSKGTSLRKIFKIASSEIESESILTWIIIVIIHIHTVVNTLLFVSNELWETYLFSFQLASSFLA